MLPVIIFEIMLAFSLILLGVGLFFNIPWSKLFGSLFLLITGIVSLWSGGIETAYVMTSTSPIAYTSVGLSTTTPWVASFLVALMLISFISIYAGQRVKPKNDPFFS